MPRGENRPSILLSRDENEQVFGLIGAKCQSLATAVVQLFTTEGPGHSEWKKKDTGVLCLIKDNSKRSYFFRIYCLYRKTMIWEHEVYMQIEYKSPRPYLHTFEAEEYMTAFNFANEDEAKILRNILIEKIELRKQRREERRQRSVLSARANSGGSQGYGTSAARHNGVAPPVPSAAPTPAPTLPPKSNTVVSGNYTLKNTSKKPKARKLTKADIGMPHDFKHISHVGWDANKGFDVENLPEEEMRSFFSKAGISETQLQDQATRQFIYDFINTHGGFDAVKEELIDSDKPGKGSVRLAASPGAPPAPPAPPVPARSPAPQHPPAPPSRAPPPPPARAVPPPPPPPSSLAPRNPPPPRPVQPPSSAPPSVPPPPPPPSQPPPTGAPPPPPPPPPAAPPAPIAPPMPAEATASTDPRAALMESIRSGNKNLKKVEVASKAPVVEDSRSNLLSEIRQGVELKSVSRSASNSGSERRAAGLASGLAGALQRALAERSRAIHSDSDDDLSDATTSDGEWDD